MKEKKRDGIARVNTFFSTRIFNGTERIEAH